MGCATAFFWPPSPGALPSPPPWDGVKNNLISITKSITKVFFTKLCLCSHKWKVQNISDGILSPGSCPRDGTRELGCPGGQFFSNIKLPLKTLAQLGKNNLSLKTKNSDKNPPNQLRFHDAKMHVTYRILEHYHAFHFFQPPFHNGMLCFLNSLRHIVKTKVSMPYWRNFCLSELIGLGHSFRQRYHQNKTKLR